MIESITTDNFWSDPRVKELPVKGKLVLAYFVLTIEVDGKVRNIPEDVSLATGVEVSECEDWMDRFEKLGFWEVIS